MAVLERLASKLSVVQEQQVLAQTKSALQVDPAAVVVSIPEVREAPTELLANLVVAPLG